jgi:hypothetical protein
MNDAFRNIVPDPRSGGIDLCRGRHDSRIETTDFMIPAVRVCHEEV